MRHTIEFPYLQGRPWTTTPPRLTVLLGGTCWYLWNMYEHVTRESQSQTLYGISGNITTDHDGISNYSLMISYFHYMVFPTLYGTVFLSWTKFTANVHKRWKSADQKMQKAGAPKSGNKMYITLHYIHIQSYIYMYIYIYTYI